MEPCSLLSLTSGTWMFEFKYFYNESRIKVVSPFPEENSIALLEAEPVLRQKSEKRKTITFDKSSTCSNFRIAINLISQ